MEGEIRIVVKGIAMAHLSLELEDPTVFSNQFINLIDHLKSNIRFIVEKEAKRGVTQPGPQSHQVA
jgi:hypothetical protein